MTLLSVHDHLLSINFLITFAFAHSISSTSSTTPQHNIHQLSSEQWCILIYHHLHLLSLLLLCCIPAATRFQQHGRRNRTLSPLTNSISCPSCLFFALLIYTQLTTLPSIHTFSCLPSTIFWLLCPSRHTLIFSPVPSQAHIPPTHNKHKCNIPLLSPWWEQDGCCSFMAVHEVNDDCCCRRTWRHFCMGCPGSQRVRSLPRNPVTR